jgi:hypothetical protein
VGEDDIERLIRDLDADEFAVRQKASEDLAKLGAARPAAGEALKNNPPAGAEATHRGTAGEADANTASVEKLRPTRTLEVLEHRRRRRSWSRVGSRQGRCGGDRGSEVHPRPDGAKP